MKRRRRSTLRLRLHSFLWKLQTLAGFIRFLLKNIAGRRKTPSAACKTLIRIYGLSKLLRKLKVVDS